MGWAREVDEDNEAAPWKEQENWEGEQIAKASMAVGAKDKARQAQQYDYVFEDQIDFITDMALAGDVVRCRCSTAVVVSGCQSALDSTVHVAVSSCLCHMQLAMQHSLSLQSSSGTLRACVVTRLPMQQCPLLLRDMHANLACLTLHAYTCLLAREEPHLCSCVRRAVLLYKRALPGGRRTWTRSRRRSGSARSARRLPRASLRSCRRTGACYPSTPTGSSCCRRWLSTRLSSSWARPARGRPRRWGWVALWTL